MSAYLWVGNLVVTVDSLYTYLSGRDWKSERTQDRKCLLFSSPDLDDFGNPITLLLPAAGEDFDSRSLIETAIRVLSHYYGTDEAALAKALISANSDIVRKRVPSVRADSIQIEMATKILGSFVSIGNDANRIERSITLQSKAKLPSFGQMSRMGHTFPGSFGFTVFTPLPDAIQEDLGTALHQGVGVPQVPFQRRVIERIARELTAVVRSMVEKDIGPMVDESQFPVSRKLCESMASIWSKNSPLEIEYQFEWSARWKVADDNLLSKEPILLLPSAKPLLQEASKVLHREETPHPQVITGVVSDLHKIYGDFAKTEKDRKRMITIMWEPTPKQVRRVQVVLEPEDYQVAVKAHDADKMIRIEGLVRRKSPFFQLLEPKNLEVLGSSR